MLRRHWAAAVLFLCLTVILTNPLVLHAWNAVEDKQDALLNTWIIAWVGHALVTDPPNLYNANIFYPYSNTLALSEALVPQGLLALPITMATDNPIFGYNLVLLAMLWLNAFAMYLLVLDWSHSQGAGWVAGAIYAFNPFNLGNLAQIQLLSLGWLPLTILYLRRLLENRAESSRPRPAVQDAVLFALFFVLQSLSSIYFAVLAAFTVAVYFLWWAWTQLTLFRLGNPLRLRAKNLLWFSLALLVIAVSLVPFLLPYLSVQRELGLQRSVADSEPFSANLKQFIEVSPQNVIYGKWLAPNPVKYNGGYPLDNLFPGLIAVILTWVGLASSKMRERWFLLALLVAAFVLALGPRLYLTSESASDLTLPYRWMYDLLPFMRALRAPVRFEALIMFALAVLAGLGIAALATRGHATLLALGAISMISIEYLALPASNITPLPVASGIQPVYRWLAHQPASVTLELPMMGPNSQNQLDISKEYFTTYHWQNTPDGYSGFNPPRRGEIAYEMQFFPGPRAISLLEALGVRHLLVHFDEFAGVENPPNKVWLDQISGLRLEQDFGTVSVYSVAPLTPAPVPLEKRLYLPQPAQAGSPYTAYLILVNTASKPFAVRPTDKIDFVARWSDGRTEEVSTPLRLVTSSASVVPIPLQAPARPGKYSLEIRTDQGLIGQARLSGAVDVGGEGAQELVIPAQVELQEPLASEYARGTTVSVRLNWQPLNKVDAYYSVSVRVVDEQGHKVEAVDRQPSVPVMYWTPDVEVPDEFDLRLPGDLAPGNYGVELFMYNAVDQSSVLLLDRTFTPREVFALGRFRVK